MSLRNKSFDTGTAAGDQPVDGTSTRLSTVLRAGKMKDSGVPSCNTGRLYKDLETMRQELNLMSSQDLPPAPFVPRVIAKHAAPSNLSAIQEYFEANPGGENPPIALNEDCPICLCTLDGTAGGFDDDYIPRVDGDGNPYYGVEAIIDGLDGSGQVYFAECLYAFILSNPTNPRCPITRKPIPFEIVNRVRRLNQPPTTRELEVAAEERFKNIYNANIVEMVASYIKARVLNGTNLGPAGAEAVPLQTLFDNALARAGVAGKTQFYPVPLINDEGAQLYNADPTTPDVFANERQLIRLVCVDKSEKDMPSTLAGLSPTDMITPPLNYKPPNGYRVPILLQERDAQEAADAAIEAAVAHGQDPGAAGAAGADAVEAVNAAAVAAAQAPRVPVIVRNGARKEKRGPDGARTPFMTALELESARFKQVHPADYQARRLHYTRMGEGYTDADGTVHPPNLKELLFKAYHNRLAARRLYTAPDQRVSPYPVYYVKNVEAMFTGQDSAAGDDFWSNMLSPGGGRRALRQRINTEFVRPFLQRKAQRQYPDGPTYTVNGLAPVDGATRREQFVTAQITHNNYTTPIMMMFSLFAYPFDVRIFNFRFQTEAMARDELLTRLVSFACLDFPAGSDYDVHFRAFNERTPPAAPAAP